jgi:hypothetical protein
MQGTLAFSRVTFTGGNAGTGNGGGIRNDGGKLWLNQVILRGDRARKGGSLYNHGPTSFSRVLIEGNHATVGAQVFDTRAATLAWRRSPVRPPVATGEATT